MSQAQSLESFRHSLTLEAPASGLPPALVALWHAGRGEWETAHRLVQNEDDTGSAWVHAYLHRQEGDFANAATWYRKAGRSLAQGPLAPEWEAIATALLDAEP
jgi:hypothetical protein